MQLSDADNAVFGSGLNVMDVEAVAVHPLLLVTTTVYVPLSVTVFTAPVSPPFQANVTASLAVAVSCTEVP
jgi:hypothetical protein